MSNDAMMKKTILQPGSAKGPPPGAVVTIHYVCKHLDDSKFASTREVITLPNASLTSRECNSAVASGPYTFTLGEGSVVQAWERAVPGMLVGERCEVTVVPPLAYGEAGAPHLGVAPNEPVKFELELLNWQEPRVPRKDMAEDERLAKAADFKVRGTESFKKSSWDEAKRLYDDAAYYVSDGYFASEMLATAPPDLTAVVDTNNLGPPPQMFNTCRDETQALLVSCLLNAAQCCLKLEEWRDAEARCSKALQLEPKNIKALFRRGLSRCKMGDYGDAKRDLRRANELDPKSREIRAAFDECNAAEAEERAANKAFYSSTGAATGGYVAPEPEPEPKPFIC